MWAYAGDPFVDLAYLMSPWFLPPSNVGTFRPDTPPGIMSEQASRRQRADDSRIRFQEFLSSYLSQLDVAGVKLSEQDWNFYKVIRQATNDTASVISHKDTTRDTQAPTQRTIRTSERKHRVE